MAIKFFNVLKGLTKIFKAPDVNNPITEQVSPSNYTTDAVSSGITEDSIVHINCDSSDAATFGAHYLSGTDVLMVNGSPFVDAKNIVHGISTQIAYGTIYFLAPKGLLKNTDEVRIGRIKRTKNWSESKDVKTTKGLTVPYIDYINYKAADGSTVTYQNLHLQWALNDKYSTIEKFGIANYDDTELITETLFIDILLKGAISGTGTDPKFKIGDKIAFSIWRDGYQISDWFTWRIATHAAGVDSDGIETPAKNILVPSKGLYLPGIQEVTSAKLMKKLENSKLVPGRQYKIVDYDPDGTLSDVLPATIPGGEVCVTAISKCELSPMYVDAYNAYVNGGISADSFTTTDGTDSQFLMANGTTLDGLNATATKVSADSDPSVTFANGTFNFNIPSGKDGAKGDKGDTGATGATGPQGSVKSLSTDGSGAVVTNVSLANDALTVSKGDVGGRNLLREGKWRNTTITSSTYLGNPVYSCTYNESTASGTSIKYNDVTYTGTLAGLLRNKGVYTVSFYAKASAAIADSNGGKIVMHFYNVYQSAGHYLTAKVKASWGYTLNNATGGDGKTYNISLTTAWQKYYVTYTLMDTVPEESTCNPSLILFRLFSTTSGTTVYFSNVKLEEGAVPTAWCPAHEDLEIGGRNLAIFKTATVNNMTKGTNYNFTQITADTTKTTLLLHIDDFDGSNLSSYNSYVTNIQITAAGTYSYAIVLKVATSMLRIKANGSKWDTISNFFFTETLAAGTKLVVSLTFTNVTQGSFAWKNVKIEKGNKPTDWTPAPEDVDASIATAQSAAQAYADDAISNMEIGGRNLLKNSANRSVGVWGTTWTNYVSSDVTLSKGDDYYQVTINRAPTNGLATHTGIYGQITNTAWADRKITISAMLYSSYADKVKIGLIEWYNNYAGLTLNQYYNHTQNIAVVANKWQQVSWTFESVKDLYVASNNITPNKLYLIIAGTNIPAANAYWRVKNWKVEFGNKPTDWTPAPEDVDASIATAQSAAQAYADANCLQVDGSNQMNVNAAIRTRGGDTSGIILRDNGTSGSAIYNIIGIAKKAGDLTGQVTAGYGDLVIGSYRDSTGYPMVLRTKGDTLYHYNGSASYKIYDRNNLWIPLALSGTAYDTTYLPNGDLNDLTTFGFYFCTQSSIAVQLKNRPTNRAFGIQVYPAAGCIQILTEYDGGGTYIRTYYAFEKTWSSWKQIYYDSDVAAKFVQKAGDTMTGNLAIATATDPTLTLGSSTIKYNSTTGCLEIKA